MPTYLEITDAIYKGDYKIQLTFTDGATVLVDFEPFLSKAQHNEIRKYLDIKEFQKFQIRDGDLDWNDFELCFPISDLYAGKVA